MIQKRGRLKDEETAWGEESTWAGDVNYRSFSNVVKKAAIKQELVVIYKIDILSVFFLAGRDSYSENITGKRSKAIYNHSNKNELVSSFVKYVGTSYFKRIILFSDSFCYWDLGRQHMKKIVKYILIKPPKIGRR